MLPFICEGHFHLFEKSNPSFEKMIPVEGHEHLFRDEKTGAIINTDSAGYKNYLSDKRRNSDRHTEMNAMKDEIETLKSMLNDLASKITS